MCLIQVYFMEATVKILVLYDNEDCLNLSKKKTSMVSKANLFMTR